VRQADPGQVDPRQGDPRGKAAGRQTDPRPKSACRPTPSSVPWSFVAHLPLPSCQPASTSRGPLFDARPDSPGIRGHAAKSANARPNAPWRRDLCPPRWADRPADDGGGCRPRRYDTMAVEDSLRAWPACLGRTPDPCSPLSVAATSTVGVRTVSPCPAPRPLAQIVLSSGAPRSDRTKGFPGWYGTGRLPGRWVDNSDQAPNLRSRASVRDPCREGNRGPVGAVTAQARRAPQVHLCTTPGNQGVPASGGCPESGHPVQKLHMSHPTNPAPWCMETPSPRMGRLPCQGGRGGRVPLTRGEEAPR
jgi:hypothetical protein